MLTAQPLLMAPVTKTRRPKSADGSKPLRSSPLAGPALNHSLPPLCHLHPKSCQTASSSSNQQPFCDSCSAALRRRSHGLITAGIRTQSLDTTIPRPRPAVPDWETDPFQSLPPRTRARPQTSTGVSSFRRPIPIVEEDEIEPISISKDTSASSSTTEFTHQRSTSLTRDNSWYTANPYDVTPRFSRLGLSGSTVVMPLSPKEHRRLSRTNSTSPTTQRFSLVPTLSPKSPTRISLQPPSPIDSPTQPLSRATSTTSISATSSITSASHLDTPASLSRCTSAPSLTRSRNSGDSISTCYESLAPTTPPDTEDTEREVDDDKEILHSSDITLKVQPDPTLTQPKSFTNPSQTPIQIPPCQSLSFPKGIKKCRDSVRTKLVRIKLQPVDFDDFQNSFSTLKTTTTTTTTTTLMTTTTTTKTTTTMTAPVTASMTTTEMGVMVEVPVSALIPGTTTLPTVMMKPEDSKHADSVPPTPIVKKKRSIFKSILKSLTIKW